MLEATVSIYTGLPGSGKSFKLVGEMLNQMVEHKCRVFTNLPLRHKVVRQWLRNRGGESFAKLLYPLTEEHFKAFLVRSHKRVKFREKYRARCSERRRSFREGKFERLWLRIAGPDVLQGSSANWIPAYAVIIIDEAQHWFSAASNRDRTEPPELLSYLTMHRHFLHRVYFATQDMANVSVTIRRLVKAVFDVRRRGNDPIAWGLRWGHVGLNPMACVEYDAAVATSNNPDLSRPVSDETWFPSWPKYRWRFRLYDSYTHVGGIRRLQAVADRAKSEAGVDGVHLAQFSQDQSRKAEKMRKRMIAVSAFVVGGIVGAVGFAPEVATASKAVAALAAPAPEKPPEFDGSLTSVAKSGVVVDKKYVPFGGFYGKFKVVGMVRGVVLFTVDQWMYAGRVGGPVRYVGTVDEVDRRVRSSLTDRSIDGGGRVPAASDDPSRSVGLGVGDP